MKITPFQIAGIVCFMIQSTALHAQEDIPNEFSFVTVEASDSYEFAKACMPSISESSFNRSIRESGDKATVTTWPVDKVKPFVAVTKGKVYCVKRSEQGNPVLPLVVFDDTISFTEMPKDDVRRLRAELSRQLAKAGSASTLVVNDKGNAYQIAFLFNSDKPDKLYYHAGFLRKGEFDESKFTSVFRTAGGMSITGRGQQSENYTPILR